MGESIRHYVESFFETIPFSESASAAKDKIISVLSAKYADGDFERLVADCPSLPALAALAGYSEADAAAWRSETDLTGPDDLKKQFRRQRRAAYWTCVPAALSLSYLVLFFFYRGVFHLALCAALAGLAIWMYSRRPRIPGGSFSLEACNYLRQQHDKYTKKTFNTLFLSSFILAATVFSALCANNSKAKETLEFFEMNLGRFEICFVLLGKNFLLAHWTNQCLKNGKSRLTGIYLGIAAAVSALYWGTVIVMFRMFNTSNFVTFYMAGAVYALLALAFTLTLRRKVTFQNIRVNKPRAAVYAVVGVALGFYLFLQKDVWLTQPYINTVPNISQSRDRVDYDDGSGVYTVTRTGEDFRILQLTDIHLGGSITSYTNDIKALKACFALIDYAKPDLVVVTGDLTYPVGISSFSLNNTAPVQQFASFMRNTGVPWAFTYGNHDTEAMAASSKETLNDLYMSLSWKTSKNLLYPYAQPDIMGRNNQLIEIRNADGSLNSALFLIDSNAYIGQGFSKYDYIRDEQVDWYAENVRRLCAEAGRTLPSYCFFHIPLQEYETAYDLYLAGSDQVTYYFGANDEGEICAPETPSKLFSTAKELGSTQGFFCGHDHYNNMSLEYEGMRLTYGMSIDYLVMPGIANKTRQRGGTIIDLDGQGNMTLRQIPLTEVQNIAK